MTRRPGTAASFAVGLTSNRKDEAMTHPQKHTIVALIDRLMHHGEASVIEGNSYRTKGKKTDSNDEPAPASSGICGCRQWRSTNTDRC